MTNLIIRRTPWLVALTVVPSDVSAIVIGIVIIVWLIGRRLTQRDHAKLADKAIERGSNVTFDGETLSKIEQPVAQTKPAQNPTLKPRNGSGLSKRNGSAGRKSKS